MTMAYYPMLYSINTIQYTHSINLHNVIKNISDMIYFCQKNKFNIS